jgi:hypothetical protein
MPEAKNCPTVRAQMPRYQTIARSISRQLRNPIIRVRLGDVTMLGTTMPKAAVDEDDQLFGVKNKIRCSENPSVTPPSSDVIPSHHS